MLTIQDFWIQLKSVLSLARHAINDRLARLGLTSAAGDVIFHLMGEDSGLSQEALCARLNIGKAAISRTVDALVIKGYAQRAKRPGDARACIVSLTQSGRDISSQVSEAYDSVFQDIKRDISNEDLLGISLLLNRIRNNLDAKRDME